MNTADDLHTSVTKEIEEQLEALRKLWGNLSHMDAAIWRSQILRWRETTLTIIGTHLGGTEQQRFRQESKGLKSPGEDAEQALAQTVDKLDAYLVALLDTLWVRPELIVSQRTDPAETLPEVPRGPTELNELPVHLFNVYGLKAIVAGVALALALWGFAHFAAQPGTEVHILWGLASYTKGGDAPTVTPEFIKTEHEIRRGNQPDREYLLQRPNDLLGSVASMSRRESNEFQVKNFRDKWMQIRGKIDEIDGVDDLAEVIMNVDGVESRFLIRDDDLPHVNQLRAGDSVTLEGKFAFLNKAERWVSFSDSEIK